jgi:GTPase Era involved in 16S rRNA processing
MKYNPYKVETELYTDDFNFIEDSKLSKYKYERLQVWVEELFPSITEILNETDYQFIFTGTLLDYEDICASCIQFIEKNRIMNIELEHHSVQETDDKFQELEDLVEMMQSGPFETFRNPKIRTNFERALNSEFEIAVIATMSSGKSTLINSFLGQELMPSKNEACTAKISRIKNNPNMQYFSAEAYDDQGNLLDSIHEATVEDFEKLNEDKNITLIEIEGKIPSIKSGKMNLVLVDTPGPNNSMDSSHREHTFSVIKNDDKPMVLYVLNATQLRTDDDLALLRTVADAMAVGGKQSKDRFLFALNKADEFDPEKGEYIGDAIEHVRMYLEEQGIKNPNIYPVSAQTAKVIRKVQNGIGLTRQEKKDYNGLDLFLEEPSMHLNEYSPLSPSLKQQVQNVIDTTGDKDIKALQYSGIPSVEAAINEYLEKYAVTSKITNAVNTFKRIVEQQQIMTKLQDAMISNEEERSRIFETMQRIDQELEQGTQAQIFKDKILSMQLEVDPFFEETNNKTFSMLNDITEEIRNNDRMRKSEAEVLLFKINKDILFLQDDTVTDLDNVISRTLRKNAESYLNEYKQYVENIVDFKINSIQLRDWDRVLTTDTPDIEELLHDFSFSQKEVVGTKMVKNNKRKFWKPWTLFQPKEIKENIYGNVEYVDMEEVRDQFLIPIMASINENIQDAIEFTEDELTRLQSFFLSEIKRLDEVMKIRVQNFKELAANSEVLEQQLEEQRQQKQWLNEFTMKLNNILELKEKEAVQL